MNQREEYFDRLDRLYVQKEEVKGLAGLEELFAEFASELPDVPLVLEVAEEFAQIHLNNPEVWVFRGLKNNWTIHRPSQFSWDRHSELNHELNGVYCRSLSSCNFSELVEASMIESANAAAQFFLNAGKITLSEFEDFTRQMKQSDYWNDDHRDC